MNTIDIAQPQRDERTSAAIPPSCDSESMFRQLFEGSADAIFLFDPAREFFVDCNQAAVEMMRASDKQQLLMVHPAELSPEFQPDGQSSREKTPQVINVAIEKGSHRFEWRARRMDGQEFPLEVLLTPIQTREHLLIATVCRDITDRKRAEQSILELNASLEQRVVQRTCALTTSEERCRALVEHAPEAIVVFDGDSGRFLYGNEHACRLYGVPMEKLATLTPADVSPEFQPCGGRSIELAREMMDDALAGGMPVFEWTHQQPDGNLIATEVRLLHLPSEGQNLIRASIIDNTERKRAQRELRESEEKFRALFEGSSQGVVLHDENQILEVLSTEVALALNADTELPAMLQQCAELAVRHLDVAFARVWTLNEATQTLELQASAGCYTHIDGPHSRVKLGQYKIGLIAEEKKPHLTNSVQTDPRVSDREWAAREGMIAFAGYPLLIEDRVLGVLALFARRPLTDDIMKALGSVADSLALGIERKRAQTALEESETRFSVAFQASPIFFGIARMDDGRFVLINDAFVNWAGYDRAEILGRNTTELIVWERQQDREAYWEELRRTGSIRSRECRFRNRNGTLSTMLMSSEVIQLNRVPHMLTLALDITERKQAEAELRASEARLRESEARFSVAFQASPVITAISRACDSRFVIVNDAALNWSGFSRDEIIGHTGQELGIWESPLERERFWEEARRLGSIRERECRLRNRRGRISTMLASGAMIEIGGEDHLLVMMVDISSRKQAEVEMLKALGREQELSQLKSNFVSMVSHEFRTPLGIIHSSAELLRDFYQKMSPPDRNDQLESITRNTRRMAAMMEEILVLSRLDAGKLDFQPTALDLNLFCRRVVDEVLSATNRRCPIELSLAGIAPAAKADERLLGHIFTNLLSNAVKYSDPGATVSFAVERDGADVVCIVRDAGIGIPGEDQEHLFEAFYRGGNVGTRPGTGLGLLVVKRCVELHRGNVQLNSRLGEGTTVAVRLPVFGEEL